MNDTGWVLSGLGVFALIGGGLAYYYYGSDNETDAWLEQTVAPTSQPSVTPAIRHPISPAEPQPAPEQQPVDPGEAVAAPQPTPSPLPALADSDAPLLAAAKPWFGASGLPEFLVPTALIEHLVVTVDNLDRVPIRLDFRPLRHVPDQPHVDKAGGDEKLHYLKASNTERYTPYVQALDSLDPTRVAKIYRRFYPLFQQAYQRLGYPQAYFNDRLIDIIDHLLETPNVEYPIAVVQPKVYYEFADRSLEQRSWGQKIMIRLGPTHRSSVNRFLRALRAELTAAP